MKARLASLLAAASITGTGTAEAQLLPAMPRIGELAPALGPVADTVAGIPERGARALEALRIDRVAALVRRYPDRIVKDPQGFPARAGELVLTDPDAALVAAATRQGYREIESGDLLGVRFTRLAVPPGRSLAAAIRDLRRLGASDVAADQLHVESGAIATSPIVPAGAAGPSGAALQVGVIDGGVADAPDQRGFAIGAPRPSAHGSAVASLIAGRGPIRGAAPGARLVVADVYGADPAGGNATAIAKALAWLAARGVPVVNVSLVGPANPLLARVVAAAQARGMLIVAPVGNDGPASPPSFPASYPGVVAVTGVDARNRVLIEAGRATHLDYAAPGADMMASAADGAAIAVRGTSFAAPLVAATLARAYPSADPGRRAAALGSVDRGARPLGPRYGRGIVCGDCRTQPR
ncbi:S8 family serine peptidase [Sphingomonas sp.]|uniref:S8 family serine peptidase n=1 Tax=Sphingomonas sp. TaxID=28214 RepID=UPI0025871615|nr:S8 family serine peptidase [Sphingomonas sp.]